MFVEKHATVYSGRGRPRVHGHKFKLNDPETWIDSAQTIDVNDSKLGLLKIRVWHDLHFRSCAKHPMSLVLVERLKEDGSVRVAKPSRAGMGRRTNANPRSSLATLPQTFCY